MAEVMRTAMRLSVFEGLPEMPWDVFYIAVRDIVREEVASA